MTENPKTLGLYIESSQKRFTEDLDTLVDADGRIDHERTARTIRELIDRNFPDELRNTVRTEFLVIKMSKEQASIVYPDPRKDKEARRDIEARVNFIEKVFPEVRYTPLFFDAGERLVQCLESGRYEQQTKTVSRAVAKRFGELAVGFSTKDLQGAATLSSGLVIQLKASSSKSGDLPVGVAELVEGRVAEFLAGHKEDVVEAVRWVEQDGGLGRLKSDEKTEVLERAATDNYGFGKREYALFILLLKMMVFSDMVVFFFPNPQGKSFAGGGGIIWGVAINVSPDSKEDAYPGYSASYELLERTLGSTDSIAMMLGTFIDKLLVTQHARRARNSALRAAIVAIMSRNMSHSVGSHVMTHYLAGRIPYEPRIPEPAGDKTASRELTENESKELDDRCRIRFLDYLKTKMDYVAELATHWREVPW